MFQAQLISGRRNNIIYFYKLYFIEYQCQFPIDSSNNNNMETLTAMGFDRRTVEYCLNKNRGNVDATLEELLAGLTVDESSSVEQSNKVRHLNYYCHYSASQD